MTNGESSSGPGGITKQNKTKLLGSHQERTEENETDKENSPYEEIYKQTD